MAKEKQERYQLDPRTWLLLCLLGIASIILIHSEIGGLCIFLCRSCVLISFVLPAFYRNRLGWSNAGGERCYFFGEFHVIKHRYHWPQGNYSPCICSLPCEGADRLSDGGFAGHAFPKGCRDSGLGSFTIFPNDLRGIPGHPFFPAVSGNWGRRGSHAYPSSFYFGIYFNPADFKNDKGGRGIVCFYDGARCAVLRCNY